MKVLQFRVIQFHDEIDQLYPDLVFIAQIRLVVVRTGVRTLDEDPGTPEEYIRLDLEHLGELPDRALAIGNIVLVDVIGNERRSDAHSLGEFFLIHVFEIKPLLEQIHFFYHAAPLDTYTFVTMTEKYEILFSGSSGKTPRGQYTIFQ